MRVVCNNINQIILVGKHGQINQILHRNFTKSNKITSMIINRNTFD